MSDTYTLELTGAEVEDLLTIIKNSNVTDTQLGYLNGLTSNIQSQLNTLTSSISSHTQSASTITEGTFAGKVSGDATAEATLTSGQFRNVFLSSADPTSSDGANGDIWIVYDA